MVEKEPDLMRFLLFLALGLLGCQSTTITPPTQGPNFRTVANKTDYDEFLSGKTARMAAMITLAPCAFGHKIGADCISTTNAIATSESMGSFDAEFGEPFTYRSFQPGQVTDQGFDASGRALEKSEGGFAQRWPIRFATDSRPVHFRGGKACNTASPRKATFADPMDGTVPICWSYVVSPKAVYVVMPHDFDEDWPDAIYKFVFETPPNGT